jgi:hypothetical protein
MRVSGTDHNFIQNLSIFKGFSEGSYSVVKLLAVDLRVFTSGIDTGLGTFGLIE